MGHARINIPYTNLVTISDSILDESDDDTNCLAQRIGLLDDVAHTELLTSDLLNAFRVFYFCFCIVPDELIRERLELEPAYFGAR